MKRRIFVLVLGMILMLNSGQVFAQQKTVGYKDPKTATSWGYLLPGAGHLYAGEGGKGLLLMVGSVGALAAGTIMTINSGDEDAEVGYDYDFSKGATDWTPSYIGLGVYAVGWIYSVVDAGKAAERTNRKRGLSVLPVRLEPYAAAGVAGKVCGVRLRVKL